MWYILSLKIHRYESEKKYLYTASKKIFQDDFMEWEMFKNLRTCLFIKLLVIKIFQIVKNVLRTMQINIMTLKTLQSIHNVLKEDKNIYKNYVLQYEIFTNLQTYLSVKILSQNFFRWCILLLELYRSYQRINN